MAASSDIKYFRAEHCVPSLQADTKEAVIQELVHTFQASGKVDETQSLELAAEVLAREEEATTGIGKGVAMPHTRGTTVVDETLIAVGVHEEGVDFDALDGASVHVVFLIVAPDPDEYLRVARRIAQLGRDDVEMRALPLQKTAKRMATFLEEAWRGAT